MNNIFFLIFFKITRLLKEDYNLESENLLLFIYKNIVFINLIYILKILSIIMSSAINNFLLFLSKEKKNNITKSKYILPRYNEYRKLNIYNTKEGFDNIDFKELLYKKDEILFKYRMLG